MNRLTVIDSFEDSMYDDRLARSPGAHIFHTSAWGRVLSLSYGYSPVYLSQITKNEFSFLLPLMSVDSMLTGHRGVSLPFTDFCEPIVKSETISLKDLLETIPHRRWRYIEFRGTESLAGESTPYCRYLRHAVNLTLGRDGLYKRIRGNVRRNITRAGKSGISVKVDHSTEAMESFYRLNCLTRKRHGLPPQPVKFFHHLQREIISRHLGTLILAMYRRRAIAGAVYLHFNKKVVYKYGASDYHYQAMRPNNLIMWTALDRFSANGFHTLDLGRTETDQEGLRRFKLAWGAHEVPLSYFRYDLRSRAWCPPKPRSRNRTASLFRLLPVNLLQTCGALLYKHAG